MNNEANTVCLFCYYVTFTHVQGYQQFAPNINLLELSPYSLTQFVLINSWFTCTLNFRVLQSQLLWCCLVFLCDICISCTLLCFFFVYLSVACLCTMKPFEVMANPSELLILHYAVLAPFISYEAQSWCIVWLKLAGQNIRKLVKDGFIIRKPQKIHSRSRARREHEAKKKGRHSGYGL